MKRLFFILLLSIACQSCHVGRFFIYNFADINDYKKFPKKDLIKSTQPFYFFEGEQSSSVLKLPKKFTKKTKEYTFDEALKNTGTVAFLAIRNDSILYQWHAPKYNVSSIVPSFSMAKSYISALLGIAIGEGFIKNTNEPITTYLPDLDKTKFGNITIQHLLDMRSGLKSVESYINPFGDVAKYYYGKNLKKYCRHLKIKEAPGKTFEYISLNTQLLGLIIENATGKPVAAYLQEKIWAPIGCEFDASWSVDSKKHQTEKAFCCINARAKDFAKFGRLYLNKGNWQGTQLVPQNWVTQSVTFTDTKNDFIYSNQWWHTRYVYPEKDTVKLRKPYVLKTVKNKEGKELNAVITPDGNFFAEGFLGQYIYVAPKTNMVFVRLAKKDGWINWGGVFQKIADGKY